MRASSGSEGRSNGSVTAGGVTRAATTELRHDKDCHEEGPPPVTGSGLSSGAIERRPEFNVALGLCLVVVVGAPETSHHELAKVWQGAGLGWCGSPMSTLPSLR